MALHVGTLFLLLCIFGSGLFECLFFFLLLSWQWWCKFWWDDDTDRQSKKSIGLAGVSFASKGGGGWSRFPRYTFNLVTLAKIGCWLFCYPNILLGTYYNVETWEPIMIPSNYPYVTVHCFQTATNPVLWTHPIASKFTLASHIEWTFNPLILYHQSTPNPDSLNLDSWPWC